MLGVVGEVTEMDELVRVMLEDREKQVIQKGLWLQELHDKEQMNLAAEYCLVKKST